MSHQPKQPKKNKPIGKGSQAVARDQRFQQAEYDPKFKAPSAALTKTKIDKRFAKMMKDPSFGVSGGVDRYGRKAEKSNQEHLKDYYYIDEQEAEEHGAEEMSEQSDEHQGIREWMQNYDQESSSLEDVEMGEEEAGDMWSEESDHVVKGEEVKATKRLALCNYDWMNITSKDLMLLFSSFKSQTDTVRRVKVYLSNIGKEKLGKEETQGPQGIWREQPEEEKKQQWRKTWKQLLQERANDNQAFDEKRLREYQKERLKYFYAVIECDSSKTADSIYRECDGNQFENSNHTFDLRFIPDDLQLPVDNLKEQCHELPQAGEVKNFITRALGHSKVTLSWEDPQLSLPANLKNKNWGQMSEQELQKIDWSRYMDQAEEDDEHKLRKLVKEQEEQDVMPDWKKASNKSFRKQEDDIQINFEVGFEGNSKKQKNKSSAKEEEPSLNKQRKSMKARRREQEEDKARRREQLKLMVDEEGPKDFKLDLQDERFQAVYSDPSYAINPQDPRFDHRRSGKVFQEVVRRNRRKGRE